MHHTVMAGEIANMTEMVERVKLVTSSGRYLLH